MMCNNDNNKSTLSSELSTSTLITDRNRRYKRERRHEGNSTPSNHSDSVPNDVSTIVEGDPSNSTTWNQHHHRKTSSDHHILMIHNHPHDATDDHSSSLLPLSSHTKHTHGSFSHSTTTTFSPQSLSTSSSHNTTGIPQHHNLSFSNSTSVSDPLLLTRNHEERGQVVESSSSTTMDTKVSHHVSPRRRFALTTSSPTLNGSQECHESNESSKHVMNNHTENATSTSGTSSVLKDQQDSSSVLNSNNDYTVENDPTHLNSISDSMVEDEHSSRDELLSKKRVFKVPKINVGLTTRIESTGFDTDRFVTTERGTTITSNMSSMSSSSSSSNNNHTARSSRGASFKKRLDSMLKKENRADIYMANMQELIKNSQNKIGEEVTATDKDFELMKVINRGTDRLLHKISLDETRDGGDSNLKKIEDSNFEFEYDTDEVYIFRDIGAEFKLFCPTVFQHLRQLFRVSEWDFKKQMGCHCGSYSRVGTPGKSGAFFFFTSSTSYLLKSVTEEELSTSLELLPHYHKHIQKNPYTLLSNFYLLFEVTLRNQNKYRFIVMNNIFFTPLTIHRKYDLKGSTAGRVATESERKKKSPILKDKDIQQGDIKLNLDLKLNFFRRLESDVRFLQENDIMDYSLLLGVHNHSQRTEEESKIISRLRLPQPTDTSFSGWQRNTCASSDGKEVYFFGIIDILQKFNNRKQVEKMMKNGVQSLKAKIRNATKERVSVEKPFKYGQRFENFLKILCSTVSINDFKPGTLKSYNQRKDISEEFYHLIIRRSPKDFKAFFYRGLFYHKIGDLVNAVADFSKSIKLNPQYANINSYLFRALLYVTAGNSILEKKGDELRYIKYANLAFKDLQKLTEMNQYCADAYLLRGILFQYKFKFHLLFGKGERPVTDSISTITSNSSATSTSHTPSNITTTSGTIKESSLAQYFYKKNSIFSCMDIQPLTDILNSLGDNIKTCNNFAITRNISALRKIIYGLAAENERISFYPRNSKQAIHIRSESLLLAAQTGSVRHSEALSMTSSKTKTLVDENEASTDLEDRQESIRAILEYVNHQDEPLYRLAERDFMKCLEINPAMADPYGFQKLLRHILEMDSFNAYVQLGLLYLDLNRPIDAEKYFTESIKKSEKKSLMAYFLRGNIYAQRYLFLLEQTEPLPQKEKMNEYLNKAMEDYKKCLEIDPNFYKAYFNMGFLYRIDFPAKSEECYNRCIELVEGYFFAIYNRGLLYKNFLGDKQKALTDFTQCISLDPRSTNCYILRANTYLEMGDRINAELDFKQAIYIDSNCASAYYSLATIYMSDEEKYRYYTNQFKLLTKNVKKVNEEIPSILQF
ncbi:hypothetical protein C9374_000468 [Naegleria lovaniensis]|uniref:PIPK domain-containing protein n=1 Tax=Naegleria lovaniensis TaxID=51637 RepID=A0AA88GYE2_NAELO|nr:uncharacterized protein C9374_000468 [Naegleria lovaniensis]KAG2388304.1 hypothetical protein C9374_000468 [Naegleria lovaniensis]